jgi:hypothetical protein
VFLNIIKYPNVVSSNSALIDKVYELAIDDIVASVNAAGPVISVADGVLAAAHAGLVKDLVKVSITHVKSSVGWQSIRGGKYRDVSPLAHLRRMLRNFKCGTGVIRELFKDDDAGNREIFIVAAVWV